MAVDVATLALELSTTGLARGERDASAILSRLEQRLDRTVQRAQAINKAINNALNIGGGASKAAASLGQSQAQFQNHQLKLQQIAQQGAQRQQAIAAQSAAKLQQIQAQSAAQQQTIAARLNAQLQAIQARTSARAQFAAPPAGALAFFKRYASTVREAGESIQQTGYFLTGLSTGLISVGAAAVKSAFDIDKNVNTLKAFLGNADAAEARLKQLTNLSQRTPGLTTSLAATLDAQLRTTNVSQSTIDKILPSIGRLNAVSPLGDPQKFAQNLNQLITQNFERTDLKELVGQSPIAGQILQQLFKVDSPTNAKAIRESAKKLGITTADEFFAAFAKTAENNPALANVTESLETRFQKLQDRIAIALRPLGLSIVKALEPIIERAVPIIERLAKAFDELSPNAKTAIVTIAGVAAALGPVVVGVGAVVQAIGAIGNLTVVTSALAGVQTGLAGIAAGALPIGAAIAAITAVLGIGVVAWNKYGASADDAINLTTGLNGALNDVSNLTDGLVSDFSRLDAAIADTFGVGFLIKFDDVLKGTAADVAIIKDSFELLGVSALATIKKITLGIENLLSGALSIFGVQIDSLEGSISRLGGEIAGLDQRFGAGFSNLRATENRIAVQESFGKMSKEDQARASLFLGETFKGIPDAPNFITRDYEAEARAKFNAPKQTRIGTGGGSSRRAESEARQLRGAEEELAKATAKARLDIEENTLRKLIELDKDSFDKRLVSADAYYERLIQNELKLQDVERQRVQAELSASQARLAGAKAGSPEALREKAQQVELEARLSILETERAGTVRKLNDELLKLKVTEKDRNDELLKAGSSFGFDIVKNFNDNFFAKQDAKRERPGTDLRIEESRIQGLGNAGLLREQQVTDALILTRRKYRDELIKSVQTKKDNILASKELTRFEQADRFDEEIASLQSLGTELTRAEQLQKRFAEQGRIDYSRLNEGVEDLLASQKGLTEIFSDFRANLVKDQFDLIDSGVDKLTKRLGVLGSAVGTLLKDLAKLALSKLFQKLLGVNTGGGTPSFGFGQQAASGNPGGSLVGSLLGGGNSGGGVGSFLTGGFAGGNPAQAAIGGGSGGGGGVLQQITGIGGGQGGGGLLSKIPVIGKLFGGGGSGGVNNLPVFTQGAGGGPLSQSGGALGGAGGVGSFASLGAGGLLAGGGLLGSLAGGNSQVGKLLGGVGGTLLGGALGASGLLGGGIAGALPALFSNPITAIAGAALIGGALLARWIGGREQRKFRKTVESEYQIKVDGKQQGTALYKSVKELGETEFGKGQFGKKMLETIKLKKAQEMIAAYAEANGQENSALAKKFRDKAELTDINDPRNRFIRRAEGGLIPGPDLRRDTVPAMLRGGEFVLTPEVVQREGLERVQSLLQGRAHIEQGERSGGGWLKFFSPIVKLKKQSLLSHFFAEGGLVPSPTTRRPSTMTFAPDQKFDKQLLIALQSSHALGGIFGGAKQKLIGQLQTQAVSGETSGSVPAEFHTAMRMMTGVMVETREALGRLKGIPKGQVVEQGLAENPGAASKAVHTEMVRNTPSGRGIKLENLKGR